MNDTQQILKKLEEFEKSTKNAIRDVEMRLTARLDSLEDGQKSMQSDISGLKTGQGQMLERVENLETDVKSIKSTVERIDDNLKQLLNSSIDEENALKARVTRIEKHLNLSSISFH